MAINPETSFPGKIKASSVKYPFGEARNITTPGDGTGTPWDQLILNDIFGFQQALLDAAGIVPTGSPDEVGASQYLDALGKIGVSTFDTKSLMSAKDRSSLFEGQLVFMISRSVAGDAGGGEFRVTKTDISTEVALDTLGGIHVPFDSDATGISGGFIRQINGSINVRWFGAKGDGTTDDQPAFQGAADEAQGLGKNLYIPAADAFYLLKKVGGVQIDLPFLTKNMVIYGDGPTTKIKRGDNTVTADFDILFSSTSSAGVHVTVRDMFVDDNRRNQTIVVAAGTGSFAFQHVHIFAYAPKALRGFESNRASGLTFFDPIADCVSFSGEAGETYGDIIVRDISSMGRQGTRSDITVTGSYDTLVGSDLLLDALEIEVNVSAASSRHDTEFVNVRCNQTLDLALNPTPSFFGNLKCTNVTAYGFVSLSEFDGLFTNCFFYLSQQMRLITGKHKFSDCKFFGNADYVAGSEGLVFNNTSNADHTEFDNCEFDADSSLTITEIPFFYFQFNNKVATKFIMRNNDFKHASIPAVRHRSGDYLFDGNTFAAATTNIIAQNLTDITNFPVSFITLRNNIALDSAGFIIQHDFDRIDLRYKNNVTAGIGQVVNWLRYDHIALPRGGTTGLVTGNIRILEIDDFEADAIPITGKWIAGQKVYNIAPAPGGKIGFVCTVSGNGDGSAAAGAAVGATFKAFGVIDA